MERPWGAFCALPCPSHTVPRGELFAVVLVVSRVAPGQHVHIVTDCWPVHQGINMHRTTGMNSDLWKHLWALINRKNITLAVTWAKSHLDRFPHLIGRYDFPVAHICCNFAADALAEKGW